MERMEKKLSGKLFESTVDRRIDACAAIFCADRAKKMDEMAIALDVTPHEAARRYTVGCLKMAIRRGTARSYGEALDRLEAEQVGDRAVSVKMPSPLDAEVKRISAINGTGGSGKAHKRNMARVIGTLYVQWDERIEETDPVSVLAAQWRDHEAMQLERNIARYMADYVTRLSPTAQRALRTVIDSHYNTHTIMTARDGEAKALRNKVEYLYRGFPHADAISARDYLVIARKYMVRGAA